MKNKFLNIVSAIVLTASLTIGALPTAGLSVRAAGDIKEAVQNGLVIRESQINQLLTEDLALPTTVTGLEGAQITYSIEGQPAEGNHGKAEIDGTTLKVTRPYAGEGDYKFHLVATVEADGATDVEKYPLTIREGISKDSYAGYVYVCFANTGDTSHDVQQVHFFLSEDGLNWTALNGCQPAFLAGSDYMDDIESYGGNSVNYKIDMTEDAIAQTASGDASALFPFEGRDQGIRDPYLIRGCKADGSDSNKVWLLATDLNIHSSHYDGDMATNKIGDWDNKIAAVGLGSTHLFIWETEDWVHWTRRWIDVAGPDKIDAAMAWAPEAIYNPEKDNYLMYWSGKVSIDGTERNRLYCCETSDFVHFGPTKLYEAEPFYEKYIGKDVWDNDGYGNIDTSQIWVAGKDKNGNDTPYGTLFRVVKDETRRKRANTGPPLLGIQLMKADTVLDPGVDYDSTEPIRITPYEYEGETYSELGDLVLLQNDVSGIARAEILYNWFAAEATGNHFEKVDQKVLDKDLVGQWEEGATIFKFIDRDEWCIMIDNYGSSKIRYEPFTSTDLAEPDSIKKVTSGYSRTGGDVGCHGGMIPITAGEYNRMVQYYNDQSKMVGKNEKAASNYHEIPLIELDTRQMDNVAEKLEHTATTAGSNYSAGVKAQMEKLAEEAKKLAQKTNVTDFAEMDRLTARMEKLLGNTVVEIPKMYADHVEMSESDLTLCTKAAEGLHVSETLTADVDVDEAPKTITWQSSNPSVATVSNGKVTAKKAGLAVITATAVGGAKASCKVTVKTVPTKVTLKKKSVTLKRKKTFQIKASVPKNTVCSTFKYKSNKSKIASVSSTGKVTAKKKGTAKITVTAGTNKKAKAIFTVKVK